MWQHIVDWLTIPIRGFKALIDMPLQGLVLIVVLFGVLPLLSKLFFRGFKKDSDSVKRLEDEWRK